jgi:hypothetical protein
MKKFVFAVLAITTIIWGTTAAALRRSPQESQVREEAGAAPNWSITKTEAAPGWSITSAHAHMW